jgi:predicted ATPase/DNA-binding CsgD family transcriptional regulator
MSTRPHDVIHLPTGALVTPALVHDSGKTVSLPAPLTRLVGREQQVSSLVDLFAHQEIRLVTLTGPGGIGKTRLAIATAHALVERFDRLVFVPLVSVPDAAQIPDAIARRLGLREPSGTSLEDGLHDVFRHRRTLLVLDNLEHLAGAAGLVARLLERSPGLHVLATSRMPLRISGEHERSVPALDLPDTLTGAPSADLTGIAAIALFLERVRAYQPDFVPDARQLTDIAEICAQLDGLPLAIELAAARLRILSVADLRQRLASRLTVLTGGGPEHAAHQRTMRNTIAWSYDLLNPDERELFPRLAVLAGTFDAAAAEALVPSAATLDCLLGLVDQNLVRRQVLPDGSVRFRMLATIREYALERLRASEDAETAWDRFALHMGDLVNAATSHLTGSDSAAWTQRLELEQPNIQAALQWLDERGRHDAMLPLLVLLQPFWLMRGQFEIGRQWLERGAALVDASSPSQPGRGADIYIAAGWLALGHGDCATAERHADKALAIAVDDRATRARALTLRGQVAHRMINYSLARQYATAALELNEAIGDAAAIAANLQMLALIAMNAGDLEQAEHILNQSFAVCERGGNAIGVAIARDTLSIVRSFQDDMAEAEALACQALAVFRAHQDVRRIAVALDHVGKCASRRGDFDRAWQMHQESLAIRVRYGDPRGIAVWLEAVAGLFAARGSSARSARLLGAAGRIRADWSAPLHAHEAIEHDQVTARLRLDLTAESLDQLLAEGQDLTIQEAVDLATAADEQSPLPAPATAADPLAGYNLTPREREVLHLITRRLSDREIAETLFISPRTVARHLAGLFGKLDVHSRREAASLARASGAFPDAG